MSDSMSREDKKKGVEKRRLWNIRGKGVDENPWFGIQSSQVLSTPVEGKQWESTERLSETHLVVSHGPPLEEDRTLEASRRPSPAEDT